jgi:hypothetical protein
MFKQPIKQFSENLEALWEFVEDVAPVLHNKMREGTEQDAERLLPLAYILAETFPDEAQSDETLQLKGIAWDSLKEKFKDKIVIERAEDAGSGPIATIQIPGNIGFEFQEAMRRFHKRVHKIELLYKNSLIALVSSAEWFLAQLLHQYFKEYPLAIGSHDKVFNFDDLRDFNTIDDARTHLIESKIEGLLRGSISDWFNYLKSHLKLSLEYIEPYEADLIEVTQRRNLLVHNGGVVNSIYMSKVPEEVRSDVKLGHPIEVSEKYLEKALRTIERVFVLVGAELWKKLSPADESRFETLFDISWKHLKAERWELAEGISYFIMQDKKQPEVNQLVGMMNYWQSLKWLGRFEEVRSDVERTDFSAKQQRFALAQAALLDDEERFFTILPRVLEAGEITEEALHEWPILRKLRTTDRFRQLYSKSELSSGLIEAMELE